MVLSNNQIIIKSQNNEALLSIKIQNQVAYEIKLKHYKWSNIE